MSVFRLCICSALPDILQIQHPSHHFISSPSTTASSISTFHRIPTTPTMTTPLTIRLKIEDVVHPDFRDLASEFECAICCALFDDPVQLLCSNRHIFCLACVREGAFQACPICLDPLPKTGAKFVALHEPAGAPHSHRMMMKLKVGRGMLWVTSVSFCWGGGMWE